MFSIDNVEFRREIENLMFDNGFLKENIVRRTVIECLTSSGKDLAIFRRTSGANLLIRSEYSPINQRMEARAVGTVTLSTMRTIRLIISPYCDG